MKKSRMILQLKSVRQGIACLLVFILIISLVANKHSYRE